MDIDEILDKYKGEIFSKLNDYIDSLLEKIDDEDLFGFHSEYYIDPRWRRYERYTSPNGERIVRKGYTRYSKYKNDIYFISRNNDGYIIKSNVKQKTSCAIKLHTKRTFRGWADYIAVNRQGYFLYNTRMITLFGFDGHEIYTHKFGQDDYVECIYIYDDKVIYSETKQLVINSQIYCINMLTKEKKRVWGTQKGEGDSVFDNHLRKSYELEWGTELPFFPTPSNIGNLSCEFLYANKHRVIAGYTRSKSSNYISYIINIDMTTNRWSILDCFPVGDNDHLPSENDRRIFSFNMIDDTMWVKTNDADIRLVHTDIQRVAQLRGKYSVEWKLCELQDASYYYFDGKNAYMPENLELYRVEKNGEKNSINFHMYQTCYFWCLDDIYIIPNEYDTKCFRNITEDSSVYELREKDIEELVQSAKLSQLETVTEIKKNVSEVATYKEEKTGCSIVNDSQMSLATFRQKAPSMTGFRDKLLSYRKSLHNRWDYNAYVGILLGVGGSKHGDAACMNYAIGQGDNGNNTKKTLAEKGLMSIFEKYKGRKIDETVMLSEVEDEIVAIVPEYEQIRQKLHEITKG